MSHEQKVEEARRAINAVFGDTSVDREQTRESLEELQSEIEANLQALDDDEAGELDGGFSDEEDV